MRRSVLVLAACVVSAACATPDGPMDADTGGTPATSATTATSPSVGTATSAATTSTTSPAPPSFVIPFCGSVPYPTAPDAWYRDQPQYVGNEMPAWEVHQFALDLPGFQTVWIDRRHNGWISVGFHGTDVEARQRELAEEFPGVGVVAVAMAHSVAQLAEIRRRVDSSLPEDMYAANVFDVAGVVEVWVGELTVDRVALVVEAVGDDPVCIEGWDPAALPPEGPQLEGGDGWRYLDEVDSGVGFDATPVLAADEAAWAALWQVLGEGDEPPVDFESEIAIAVEIGHSSSCPETRLDGVVVERALIYPEIVNTSRERSCTADYIPRTYLFAVSRERLPDPPFHVVARRMSARAIQVDVDLSEPGSAPGPGDVSEVSVTPPRRATTFPLIVETGYPRDLTLALSCGVEWLGEVNFYVWHADTDVVPAAWVEAAQGGLVELDLLLEEGEPPLLILSGHGASIRYRIDEGPAPECG